jgi:hypothetical protein
VNHCGAIVVDSSDHGAIFLTGNAVATATEADVGPGGGAVIQGQAVLNLLEPEFNQEAATPDPIALPLPPAPPIVSATPLHISAGSVTLSPGTYIGGITIDGTAAVALLPGVYYMNGGGFKVSGHGSVTDNGAGVLLVNAPASPSDVISLTSRGSMSLTAPSGLTGAYAAYNHIVIFQDPASTNTVSVAGQASLTVSGTLYAPAALLKINGNGSAVVSTDTNPTGGQVIVFDAMVTENGALTINADPSPGNAPVGLGAGAGANAPYQAWLVVNAEQPMQSTNLLSRAFATQFDQQSAGRFATLDWYFRNEASANGGAIDSAAGALQLGDGGNAADALFGGLDDALGDSAFSSLLGSPTQ